MKFIKYKMKPTYFYDFLQILTKKIDITKDK